LAYLGQGQRFTWLAWLLRCREQHFLQVVP
jgi:hypothetical protein